MSVRKILGLAATVGGIILLVYGFNARDSFASEVRELVEGTPTDQSMWLIAGGAALTIAGLGLALTGSRK